MKDNQQNIEKFILTLNMINKKFDGVEILRDFNLKVKRGEVLGIMGPSGCGKSTLLRLIAGLERPDGGQIYLESKLISSNDKIVPPNKREMGMVFQNLALWPHLTVEQHLCYGISNLDKDVQSQKVKEMLDYLDLSNLAKRYPEQLSGGERQRVSFGRALIMKPLILLCDEPFNSLDRELRWKTRDLFYEIVKEEEITTIFVSHDPEDLIEVDRIYRLDN
ncbi:ABC transporter ATP-binding protein [Orenia marismortui]|uniref:Iron(III) transport system ATP-binding protein n=1 Tax=Orenia marismortui TaxID=46469 RepID=A0A4R8H7W7_9FIRM|nr:ABC transporter ATP-binding protein [Orenia marismortui]TDX51153.1 iron(III) transport system ATP-binding protein [Orenia marismortui]